MMRAEAEGQTGGSVWHGGHRDGDLPVLAEQENPIVPSVRVEREADICPPDAEGV